MGTADCASIVFNPEQLLKARTAMEVTEEGIVRELILLHSLKAYLPIELTEEGINTDPVNLLQPKKA